MPVISILRSELDDVGTLTVGGEEIGVTGGHWIWSRTQGRWVAARDLACSEALDGAGTSAIAVETSFLGSAEAVPVWTLEVGAAHTFRVGRSRIAVHNDCDDVRRAQGLPKEALLHMDEDAAFRRVGQYQGIDRHTASERLHAIKKSEGLGGADNVVFDATGNVFYPVTGDRLGGLAEGGEVVGPFGAST